MSCQTSCGCLSIEKVKSSVWDFWVAIQLNNAEDLFHLCMALWPLTQDEATFCSF